MKTRTLAVLATICGIVAAVAGFAFVMSVLMNLDPGNLWPLLVVGVAGLGYAGMLMFLSLYVYLDAEARGMKGLLWALLILFFASLPGFLVYLLMRSPLRTCPSCGIRVQPDFVVCPGCRTTLGLTCPACRRRIRSDWVVCPFCQENLERAMGRSAGL